MFKVSHNLVSSNPIVSDAKLGATFCPLQFQKFEVEAVIKRKIIVL